MTEAIVTENLTKRFKDVVAVDSLSFAVHPHEIYGLLGLNGAGKSTTLKMLCGLLRPTSGTATVLGHSLTKDIPAIKAEIALSPQESSFGKGLTVFENIAFIARLYGMNKEEARLQTEKVMTELGLNDVARKRAGKLSGGYQRRLSIAMAIVSQPSVLFLDEPTLGLDVLARRELWKIVLSLKERMTIVLTTHYMEEAESLSDHIGILQKGTMVLSGTLSEILAQTGQKNLEEAFLSVVGKETL
jgi:ABC-2 type transport system ATP-binding protein